MQSADAEVVLESVVVVQEPDGCHDDDSSRTAASFEAPSANEAASQTWLQRHRTRIIGIASKVAAFVSLLLTALMAWPSITSAGDTRMATLLAEWTSQKDYLEFCEDHEWKPDGCAPLRNVSLLPPPAKSTLFRRLFDFRLPIKKYVGQLSSDANPFSEAHNISLADARAWRIYTPDDTIARVENLIFGFLACCAALLWFLLILRNRYRAARMRASLRLLEPGQPWEARVLGSGESSHPDDCIEFQWVSVGHRPPIALTDAEIFSSSFAYPGTTERDRSARNAGTAGPRDRRSRRR